jgi:hypothetical protein
MAKNDRERLREKRRKKNKKTMCPNRLALTRKQQQCPLLLDGDRKKLKGRKPSN